MDYPKSRAAELRLDPATQKFTDGDAANNIPPSVDSSVWANAVTDEILEVIRSAQLQPDEANVNQLNEALGKTYAKDIKSDSYTENSSESLATSKAVSDLWNKMQEVSHPVGSIYTTTVSVNPGNVFGFGTWVQYGQGRVLVGQGYAADTNGHGRYFAPGTTSGAFNHRLSANEMPAHWHGSAWGEHWSDRAKHGIVDGSRSNWGSGSDDKDNYEYKTSTVGGNGFHNNVQPYIVAYMWLRTA